MIRYLTALLVGLAVVGSAAAQGKKLVIRWHGQSFFHLTTSSGTQIVFDPHAIEAYGRVQVKADLILSSHEHNDHTQVGVVENADEKDVKKRSVWIRGLKGVGKKLDWNLVEQKVKDVNVKVIGTYHDRSQGMERGKNGVFVLEVDDIRICFLGDLGHLLTEEQLKAIGAVDVLMIPVGGVYTLNGDDAKKVVAQIKPKKYIFPMHYGTKVFDDLLTADEFLDEQKAENIRRVATSNEFIINTAFKADEPMIVMMHWKKEGGPPK